MCVWFHIQDPCLEQNHIKSDAKETISCVGDPRLAVSSLFPNTITLYYIKILNYGQC